MCSLIFITLFISDRPTLIFITDYLYVYVPDNRYAEPIFIYCNKVSEVTPLFTFSRLNNNKQLLKINIFMSNLIFKLQLNILFIKSIISNTDINNKQNDV